MYSLFKMNAQSSSNMNYSNSPATIWQDGMVSGNGEMGIIICGDAHNERIVLNNEFLYEFLGVEDIEPPFIANVMPEVKRLIKEGRYKEAKALTLIESSKKGHTEIIWTDPYHPAAELSIEQDFDGKVKDYKRSTNYKSGVLNVNWKADGIKYERDFFVSRHDNVIVGRLKASKKGKINAEFSLQHLIDTLAIKNNMRTPEIEKNVKKANPLIWNDLVAPYIEPAEYKVQDNGLIFRVKYQVNDRGYEVFALIRNKGGKLKHRINSIEVTNSDEVEVLSRVVPLDDYTLSTINEIENELNLLDSYDSLLESHCSIHSEMYDRINLSLDKKAFDSKFKDGSNEYLLEDQLQLDEINPYLLEKLFNMGRYTLISSSGSNPPNLMGIWNGEWRPAWSGDFTTDANVNLQISSANLANLPEAVDSYMSMLERICEDWEVNAFKLYGCRGYLAPPRTAGRRGFLTHFDSFPGHYWTAGAGWLLLPCYEYYQCSGDKEFLHNRLLPMMEKVALFYEDFLDTYDENGHFLFAPSYSPENDAQLVSGDKESAVANATMDLAVAKEILSNLITIYEEEGLSSPKLVLWNNMLSKMPPYLINNDGALKEWARKDLGDNYDHRHISHLYPVWPGLEIYPEKGELFDAACVAIEKRGRGNGSAHGLAHTALIATRLKMSDLVYSNLLYLLKEDYIYKSLFTSHNPHREIFNSDALHSIPAVVLEMLVYSRPGMIELIPALSENLPKGKVSGVMCRTKAKVNSLSWDMNKKTADADIVSTVDQDISIVLDKSLKEVKVNGKPVSFTGNIANVPFEKGQVYNIQMKWN